jgi:acetyl-CoA carboxylase carboxyltransferase component
MAFQYWDQLINFTWSQQAKIIASDAQASDVFDRSVSISGDGSTIISGAYGNGTGGAAYIFV